MGSRRGFRVVLDGKDRKCFVPNAFHRSVVEIEVGHFQFGRSGNAGSGAFHRKTMILGGNQDLPGFQLAYRVVPSPVTIGQLHRLAAETEAQ